MDDVAQAGERMTQEDVAIISALLGLLAQGALLPPVGTEISGTDARRFTDDANPIKQFTAVAIATRLELRHVSAANAAAWAFTEVTAGA